MAPSMYAMRCVNSVSSAPNTSEHFRGSSYALYVGTGGKSASGATGSVPGGMGLTRGLILSGASAPDRAAAVHMAVYRRLWCALPATGTQVVNKLLLTVPSHDLCARQVAFRLWNSPRLRESVCRSPGVAALRRPPANQPLTRLGPLSQHPPSATSTCQRATKRQKISRRHRRVWLPTLRKGARLPLAGRPSPVPYSVGTSNACLKVSGFSFYLRLFPKKTPFSLVLATRPGRASAIGQGVTFCTPGSPPEGKLSCSSVQLQLTCGHDKKGCSVAAEGPSSAAPFLSNLDLCQGKLPFADCASRYSFSTNLSAVDRPVPVRVSNASHKKS
eukprot:363841-Chlamydomonas_euryale.AAC.15